MIDSSLNLADPKVAQQALLEVMTEVRKIIMELFSGTLGDFFAGEKEPSPESQAALSVLERLLGVMSKYAQE